MGKRDWRRPTMRAALSPGRLVLTSCALLALAAAGCASSGTTGSRGGDPDVLTAEDLQTVQDLSAYDAVRRLRPAWMRARGAGTARATPIVYVDGMRRGSLDELSSVRASEIQEIRYLSASEATTRFGTNNTGGAIVVTTRR
jgi:hypothetical protein